MSAADELDRAMQRFAPGTAAAMRLLTMLDEAADQVLIAERHTRLHDFADGRLRGIADALGLLLGRDALTLHTEASERAVERRAARVREFERLVGL